MPVGSGAGETCVLQASSATSLPAGSTPAPGTGFYYLVRARNACGVGTYGFASAGAERVSVACP
jgi:hypothetical protein